MSGNQQIVRHLNQLVGTSGGKSQCSVAVILEQALIDQLHDGVPAFQEDRFSAVYERVETFLFTTHIRFEAWVPLENFQSNTEKLSFEEGTEITLISDDTLRAWYDAVEFSEVGQLKALGWTHAIRVPYELEKVFGDTSLDKQGADEAEQRALARPEGILSALRLFKNGGVNGGPLFITQRTWQPGKREFARWQYRKGRTLGPPFHLDNSDVERLKQLLGFIQNLNESKFRFLLLALRRFNQSYERVDPADKLIDYMIAFEALYLNDVNDQDRGEMRFRLSLRVAYFLRQGTERRRLYREMRSAYDVRSATVHGNEPKDPKVDGEEVSIQDFVSRIENYLRESLCRFLELAGQPGVSGKLVNWDTILFPTPIEE